MTMLVSLSHMISLILQCFHFYVCILSVTKCFPHPRLSLLGYLRFIKNKHNCSGSQAFKNPKIHRVGYQSSQKLISLLIWKENTDFMVKCTKRPCPFLTSLCHPNINDSPFSFPEFVLACKKSFFRLYILEIQ